MSKSITSQLAELVDLDREEYRLTDWEVEFVDSCDKRMRGGQTLSEKQAHIVSELWDKVFIHGGRR